MIETVADHVTLEQADRVAVVTIDRPEARNAMTFEMYERACTACASGSTPTTACGSSSCAAPATRRS
jgi:1,4-dihydroxy-2-naphthoyl-CoA synthase